MRPTFRGQQDSASCRNDGSSGRRWIAVCRWTSPSGTGSAAPRAIRCSSGTEPWRSGWCRDVLRTWGAWLQFPASTKSGRPPRCACVAIDAKLTLAPSGVRSGWNADCTGPAPRFVTRRASVRQICPRAVCAATTQSLGGSSNENSQLSRAIPALARRPGRVLGRGSAGRSLGPAVGPRARRLARAASSAGSPAAGSTPATTPSIAMSRPGAASRPH
jgi:hypothetical protein